MSDDVIIRAENIGKRYVLNHQTGGTSYRKFSDTLIHAAKAPLRWMNRASSLQPQASREDFWALKDINFEIKRGEVVGIIGRNGAGKSTLLKILARITEPTTGRITLKGRVASLLEVGTGFHPELTGRENIFLNGAILGMRRDEIKAKFDEIVAFAEIEKFLDTPVKRYSSGMYVRLAFAVAAHLEPEILIVDEVLAVGDAQFQKKCLGKMQDVASGGRTVLFVSHNVDAVRTLCPQAILMDSGRLVKIGRVDECLNQYTANCGAGISGEWKRESQTPRSKVQILEATCSLLGKQPNHRLSCKITIEADMAVQPMLVAVDIHSSNLSAIMQAMPSEHPVLDGNLGRKTVEFDIELPALIPGVYHVGCWIGPHFTETYDYIKQAMVFDVVETPRPERVFPYSLDHGFMVPSTTLISSGADQRS